MKKTFSSHWHNISSLIVKGADFIFSFIIFLALVALLCFSFRFVSLALWHAFFLSTNEENVVHDIAYIVVLFKAYKILVYYFRYHNLSIKYLVQIAIIAPAIEVIFSVGQVDIWHSFLFSILSISNLVIYFLFFDKIQKCDEFDSKKI